MRGKSWYYEFMHERRRYGPKSLGPISRKEASQHFQKARLLAVEGRLPDEGDTLVMPTLSEFIAEQFLPWYQAHHRPTSVRTYKLSFSVWIEQHGDRSLETFTTRLIEHDQTAMLARGWSPNYVNIHLRVLRHVLRTAVLWKVITPDRSPKVREVRVEQAELEIISLEDERRLLAALTPRLRPLVTFALHTGLRHKELLELCWRDVDGEAGVVTVQARKAKSHRVRRIPLNRTARAVLGSIDKGTPEARVFGYRSIHALFVEGRQKAGLPSIKIHTLRHTFATRLVLGGIPVPVVQDLLGHSCSGSH
jgi:integrase